MTIIAMTISLLFGRPTVLVVLALRLGALPGSRVCLFVLGQVAGTFELLGADVASVHDIAWAIRLAPPSH